MQIQGLTERQVKIADMLWMMDSKDQVHKFIQSLPPEIKQDAQLVLQMMILGILDEVTHTDEAAEVIERIKNAS